METLFTNMVSAREFLTFYYKNRTRLLLAFLLPFLLCVDISFIPVPRYKASSVLTVRMGSEYVYQPESGSAQNASQTIPFERDEIFKSEVAILSSDDLHKEVVKQLGVDNLYPEIARQAKNAAEKDEEAKLGKALIKFDKRLSVDLEKESSVITVSFEDKDASEAVKVLNVLLDLYMEKRKALYLEPRVDMAKTHSEEARQRVVDAGNALERFKRRKNILSFDAERQTLLQQRADVQRQSASISSPVLSGKLALIENKLNTLNKDEAEFNALNHDLSVANDEYSVFAHRLSEATAYEDMQRERAGSVRIIQPPSASAEPRDLQHLIIAGGFVLSLMFALVVAILLDFFSSGFLTPEQLSKAVDMPVLVALPKKKKF